HLSEARVEIQPCGDAVADSDLNLAEGGFCEDGTTCHLAETDVAVGALRSHCGLCPVDDDLAVGRVDSKVAGDRADPRVSVGVLDDCAAVDDADPQGARTRPDLGVASSTLDGDVAKSGLEVDGLGLVD